MLVQFKGGNKMRVSQYHLAVKYVQSRMLAQVRFATTCVPQRVHVTDHMVLRCMHADTVLSSVMSAAVSAEIFVAASAATTPG